MRYLITGAGGFVGSHLTIELSKFGHQVTALDLSFSHEVKEFFEKFSGIQLVVGSVLDVSLIDKLVKNSDYVIHLAAIASPEYYVREPKRTIDLNLNASIAIIELLRFSDKPIFYTSTSEIYGKNPNIPWTEEDSRVLGPTNINRWCYSTSKAMIEHYLYACNQEGSLKFSGVRIFNCYGPRLKGRVVDAFIEAVIKGDKIVIHGDGMQTRCFTYIDDLIKPISQLVTSPIPTNKFYNIGTNIESTVLDLAHMVCKISGKNPDSVIKFVSHKDAIGDSYEDIPRRVPDFSMAKAELQWQPTVSLEQGVQRMYEYCLSKTNSGDSVAPFREVDE